jgi:hypothetical protein
MQFSTAKTPQKMLFPFLENPTRSPTMPKLFVAVPAIA